MLHVSKAEVTQRRQVQTLVPAAREMHSGGMIHATRGSE